MDKALVKNAENDVNGYQGCEDQHGLVGAERLKGRGSPLEARLYTRGHLELLLYFRHSGHRLSQRRSIRNIERNGHDGKLTLMGHGKRRSRRDEMAECRERYGRR